MAVVIIGDANADLLVVADHYPLPGDDALVRALTWSSGGAGVNTAVAAQHLTGDVRLVTRDGSDAAAGLALAAARAVALDEGFCQHDSALATGSCVVIVSPDAERTLYSFRGANAALQPPAAAWWPGADWVHLCGHALIEGQQCATATAMLFAARQHGLRCSLDVCLPFIRLHPERSPILDAVAVLFANEAELQALAPGSAAAAVHQLATPQRLVVAKLGARGCIVGDGHTVQAFPAHPAIAVDATGCGDAFAAAFISGLRRGGTPARCARLANAVGAWVVAQHGAAAAMPTRAQVRALLAAAGDHDAATWLAGWPT